MTDLTDKAINEWRDKIYQQGLEALADIEGALPDYADDLAQEWDRLYWELLKTFTSADIVEEVKQLRELVENLQRDRAVQLQKLTDA